MTSHNDPQPTLTLEDAITKLSSLIANDAQLHASLPDVAETLDSLLALPKMLRDCATASPSQQMEDYIPRLAKMHAALNLYRTVGAYMQEYSPALLQYMRDRQVLISDFPDTNTRYGDAAYLERNQALQARQQPYEDSAKEVWVLITNIRQYIEDVVLQPSKPEYRFVWALNANTIYISGYHVAGQGDEAATSRPLGNDAEKKIFTLFFTEGEAFFLQHAMQWLLAFYQQGSFRDQEDESLAQSLLPRALEELNAPRRKMSGLADFLEAPDVFAEPFIFEGEEVEPSPFGSLDGTPQGEGQGRIAYIVDDGGMHRQDCTRLDKNPRLRGYLILKALEHVFERSRLFQELEPHRCDPAQSDFVFNIATNQMVGQLLATFHRYEEAFFDGDPIMTRLYSLNSIKVEDLGYLLGCFGELKARTQEAPKSPLHKWAAYYYNNITELVDIIDPKVRAVDDEIRAIEHEENKSRRRQWLQQWRDLELDAPAELIPLIEAVAGKLAQIIAYDFRILDFTGHPYVDAAMNILARAGKDEWTRHFPYPDDFSFNRWEGRQAYEAQLQQAGMGNSLETPYSEHFRFVIKMLLEAVERDGISEAVATVLFQHRYTGADETLDFFAVAEKIGEWEDQWHERISILREIAEALGMDGQARQMGRG